jgi:hypothetical protein
VHRSSWLKAGRAFDDQSHGAHAIHREKQGNGPDLESSSQLPIMKKDGSRRCAAPTRNVKTPANAFDKVPALNVDTTRQQNTECVRKNVWGAAPTTQQHMQAR